MLTITKQIPPRRWRDHLPRLCEREADGPAGLVLPTFSRSRQLFPTVCMQMMGPQAKFQMGFPYDVSSQPYQRSAPKHSFFIKTSSYCVCMQVWFAGLHQFSRKLLVLQKCSYKSPKQPISTSLQKYTTSHPPRANNHLSGANKTLPALHSTQHTASTQLCTAHTASKSQMIIISHEKTR